MKRRDFIKKSTMIVTTFAVAPTILSGEMVETRDGLYIKHPDGRDIFIPGETPMTVLEFHRAVQNEADNTFSWRDPNLLDITDPNPTRRYSDFLVEMINGYTIPDESFRKITKGTIKQKGYEYTSCYKLWLR